MSFASLQPQNESGIRKIVIIWSFDAFLEEPFEKLPRAVQTFRLTHSKASVQSFPTNPVTMVARLNALD